MLKIVAKTLYFTLIPILIFPASQIFNPEGPAPATTSIYGAGNTNVGTITPIAVSPSDPNTLFVGGCNGGIWRSTNFGTTWTPLTDNKNSLSISSIAFDPTDLSSSTLIAGVGSTSNGSLAADTIIGGPSIGALYSTDGGNTWNGLAGNSSLQQNISGVAARGSTLLVSTFSIQNPTAFGASYGLFRSTNTGTTFTKISFPGETLTSPVTSLIGDFTPATNPNNLWAAVTDPTTKTNTALFSSIDGGATWSNIFGAGQSNGLIQSSTQTVLKAATGPGNTIAVLVVDQTLDKITGVFWSNNNGASWTQLFNQSTATIDFNPSGQGVVNSAIAVDSTNSNIVYVGGTYYAALPNQPLPLYSFDSTLPINTATSLITGAGNTFCHPDVRSFIFDGANKFLVSNDGGISIKNPPSTGGWQTINGNLSLMQNYAGAYDGNNNIIISSSQDVGVSIQNAPNQLTFSTILNGNGTNAVVNDITSATTSYYYSSTEFLNQLNRVTNASGTVGSPTFLTLTGGNPGTGGNFFSQVTLNRIDPTKVAIGGSTVGATSGYGVSIFTDDLVSSSFALTPRGSALPASSQVGSLSYGTVDAPNALLAGMSVIQAAGSPLFLTSDATTTDLSALAGYTGSTTVSTVFDNRTVNRFFVMDTAQNLWGTVNTGSSFTNLTANLPANLTGTNSYRLSVEFLSNNGVNALFVGGLSNNGTLSSVAVADSNGSGVLSNYRLFGLGMPNTMVNQLSYNNKTDTLLASAFGRGSYLMYDVTSNFPAATILQFGLANNDSTPDTSILTNGTSPSRPLSKFGTGTLTISGPATYTGLTTINQGTLALSGSGDISSSFALTVANSGIFDISETTSGATIGSLTGSSAAVIHLGSKNLTVNPTIAVSTTYAGTIQDGGLGGGTGGKLIVEYPASLILTNANTFTGGVNLNQGTLQTVNNNALGTGPFAFGVNNGNTLQSGAPNLVVPNSITLNADGKVDANNQTLSLTGPISGPGALSLHGSSGIISLSNPLSTFTGNTTIADVIVALVGQADISSSNEVTLSNSDATLDVSQTTDGTTVQNLNGPDGTVSLGLQSLTSLTSIPTTFSGVIQDGGLALGAKAGAGGQFIKDGLSTLTLGGLNTYTGGTTVNAGELVVAGGIVGPVAINTAATLNATNSFTITDLSGATASTATVAAANTVTFGTQNSTSFAGTLAGAGNFTKQGSGIFTAGGTNTFNGAFNVNAGTLNVPAGGSFASTSTTNVALGASLVGNGTVGTVNLNGIVSPGNSIGILHTGNLTFNSGSIYLVELNNTAADLIDSTGIVTVNSGSTVTLSPQGLTNPLPSYTIITAASVVENASFSLVNPFTRFKFGLEFDPTSVKLILLSITDFFAKGNGAGVAKCFNTLLNCPTPDLLEVLNVIDRQSLCGWQNSFNQMQPANFNNIAFAQENVAERIRQTFSSHLFEQRVEGCPNQNTWCIWAAPFVEHVHQRNHSDLEGYKENFAGFTAAVDYQWGDWAFTTGFSYANSDISIMDERSKGDFNTYAGSIGAIWTDSHFFADGLFTYLFSSIDAQRKMSFCAPNVTTLRRKAHHHQDSNQVMGHLGGGYNFIIEVGCLDGTFNVYPFVDVDYIYVMQDEYTERGAESLNLKVNKKQYDLLRPEAGIGIGYTSCFDSAVITVDASASYIREERYLGKKTKARFNGSCCNFTVEGLNPENNLFSPNARVTLDMTKSLGFSFSLGYHGEFGSHFVENAGEAEVSFSF